MRRPLSAATGALLSVAVAWPMTVRAQQWDLRVAAASSMNSSLGAPLAAVAPSGAIAGRGWRLTSEFGTVDRRPGTLFGAAFSAAALGPRIGPLRTEVYGDFANRAGQPQSDARVAGRLHLSAPDHGVWAGAGVARAGSHLGMLRSIGGWIHGKVGSGSIRLDEVAGRGLHSSFTTFDTMPSIPFDTVDGKIVGGPGGTVSVFHPGSPPVKIHSLSARYSTPGGRLQLALGASQIQGGGIGRARSASAVATWWVDRAFALIGGYGPSVGNGLLPVVGAARFGVVWRPLKGMPRTLSLVEPSATAEVDRVGPGVWRVRLPAERARNVEIQGSFNDWEPLPMHDAGDGWWEVTLPLAPGRYELSWRRDEGGWRTLPGLPTVRDDLLGDVTVVVIDQE